MEEANRTYIGRRANLYWSVSEPIVVRIANHYWFAHRLVVVDFAPSTVEHRFPSVYAL